MKKSVILSEAKNLAFHSLKPTARSFTSFRMTLLVTLLVVCAGVARAEDPVETEDGQGIEVIDIPTANVIKHYGYFVNFRFGKEGNLQTKTAFGVFPRLNLGFGLDAEKVIGTEDARMNKPTINVKFKLFDERDFIPSIAIGYDGQGFMWNKTLDEYEQKEKGFYLVTTKSLFVPDFNMHLGVNNYDFDEGDSTRGFFGLSWVYQRLIGLMAEYDSFSEYKDRRINFGGRYFITPQFTVDAAGRNVAKYPGSESRETERIVKLNYTGSF